MMPEEGLNPETPENKDVNHSTEEAPSAENPETPVSADVSTTDSPETGDSEAATEDVGATETPETEAEEAHSEVESAEESISEDSNDEQASEATPDAPAAETVPEESDEAAEAEASTEENPQSLLQEILADGENFDTVVEKANATELVLLMETITDRGEVGDFLSKVGNVKRSFEEKNSGEAADQALAERFSTALARFNKKRKAYYDDREKEKEENSTKKYALLERLKVIVQEEKVTQINEVRNIQNEWRELGWVLQKDIQPLNETYRQYLDVFYTLRSKYQDLLDLDRAKNLQKKLEIIGKVEGLIPEEEDIDREAWTDRSNTVKELQQEWKQAGHVPRENLDSVNTTYRDVLDRFYEARKGFYELQDAQRDENAAKKQELLEQLQVYSDFKSNRAKDWNEATRNVLELQSKWKKIGPGPVEENKTLWKNYRALCDTFFNNKGTFFKSFDKQRSDNLERKIAICVKAEELQDNEDFKGTAKILKDLQKEWKTIGPVHERHSNKVWKRFRKACDHFFDRRSSSMSSERDSYRENLKLKEELIQDMLKLANGPEPGKKMDEFNELNQRWKATGHVPFKQKDKINNSFREAIGKFFDKSKLNRDEVERLQLQNRIGNISDDNQRGRKIDGEIRKLQGRIRGIQEKVDQYEINIQYITKGRSGDGLRQQIQKQIDEEKGRIADIRKKVKELRHMKDNPPQPKKKETPAAETAGEEEE